MPHHPIRRVENYTDAFLTTLGVTLFMAFWVIAATIGFLWVFVSAYGIDWLVQRLRAVRAR